MTTTPELRGRVALVTGATGGIGRAIAGALHDRGAAVKLSGRRGEVLEDLARQFGERAEALPGDLSSADDVRRLAEAAGEVDVLVSNAGIPGSGRLGEYRPEQIDRVIDVNLRSAIHLTHALLPGMLERGRGHLVYISSMSGKVATARSSLYNGTKFGLRGFAYAVREDLRGSGVGVTSVFPGFISDAGMWAEAGLDLPRGVGMRSPDQVAEGVLKGIERNRAEIDVAPLALRAGGKVAGAAPSVMAALMRRAGSERLSSALADAQKSKR